MRIAWLVHQYLPEHVGGTELYTHGLARRAAAAGHAVLVVSHRESASGDPRRWRVTHDVVDGVPVVAIEDNLSLADEVARAEYDHPRITARVRGALAAFGPDVVHCTHAMKLGAGALEACEQLGVPVVTTLCDFWFLCARHTLLRPGGIVCSGPEPDACFACTEDLHAIEDSPAARRAVADRPARLREALLRSRRVIALSEFQRRLFVAHGLPSERVQVLPHGLEPTALASRPRRHGRSRSRRPRLVFVGSVVAHKGPHVALAALARRPDLDAELVVHGSLRGGDPYADRLRAGAARDPRVHLAGSFPPERLGEVLRGADALVLPALWYENDPLVVKAALHLGVPVVVSRIGSLAEQVRDGIDGWTVPPGDVDAWARALGRAAARRLRPPSRPQPGMDEHYARIAAIYAEAAAA